MFRRIVLAALLFSGVSAFLAPHRITRPAIVRYAEGDVNKAQLIDIVAEKAGLPKKDVGNVLNAVLETIVESVSAGKKVTFLGFGSFDRRARAARMGRNPKTGEPIEIKAGHSPSFSSGKSFKDKVKGY